MVTEAIEPENTTAKLIRVLTTKVPHELENASFAKVLRKFKAGYKSDHSRVEAGVLLGVYIFRDDACPNERLAGMASSIFQKDPSLWQLARIVACHSMNLWYAGGAWINLAQDHKPLGVALSDTILRLSQRAHRAGDSNSLNSSLPVVISLLQELNLSQAHELNAFVSVGSKVPLPPVPENYRVRAELNVLSPGARKNLVVGEIIGRALFAPLNAETAEQQGREARAALTTLNSLEEENVKVVALVAALLSPYPAYRNAARRILDADHPDVAHELGIAKLGGEFAFEA